MTRLPFDHLYATALFIDIMRQYNFDPATITIMGPDYGSVQRNGNYASLLNCGMGFIDKRRGRDKRSHIFGLVGDVKDKNIFLIDDMVSSGRSLGDAAKEIMKQGAARIIGFATHPLFSNTPGEPTAVERIEDAPIERLYISDTLAPPENLPSKIEIISAAHLLAQAIIRINTDNSVSSLIPCVED
jgi:ribose-phosphate pyrophosphokinase